MKSSLYDVQRERGRTVEDGGTAALRWRCVHELFEASVERSPRVIAAGFEGRRVSYLELDRRSNRIAQHLCRAGFAKGELAGLLLPRSIDMLATMLAVHKAGGAYLPLDPAYPRERLAFMLADSGAGALITEGPLVEGIPFHSGPILDLDRAAAAIEQEPAERVGRQVGPGDLAYVIYTSGSTGQPKGVEIEHGSVLSFLRSMQTHLAFGPDDAILASTSLSFDPSVLELLLPLMVGARVEIARSDIAADSPGLVTSLAGSGVTLFQATPSGFRLLLDAGWQGGPALTLLSGGEPLTPDLASRLLVRCARLFNVYGPTETTVWCSIHRVTDPRPPFLAGRATESARIHVLDTALAPVAEGEEGEVYIGGEIVARGYRNRPDLTRERFIADPFRAPFGAGARLYRSGDRGRLHPDGCVEIVGRLDHQVKVRGHRVELGEVEQVLATHPLVREAVVVLDQGAPGERLIAYFTATRRSKAARPDAVDLRTFLRDKLPEFMVPSLFVQIPELPLTPSGKLDRRALPPPSEVPLGTALADSPPRDAVEERVWRIWASLLGIRAFGIKDDFFEVGGHSLLGAALVLELNRAFGKSLPLAALFEFRTIEKLAALIREEGEARRWPTLGRLRRGKGKRPFFLSTRPNVNALGYLTLVKYVDPDRPIYLLQVQYEEEKALGRPYTRQEHASWAAAYVGAMRAVEPEGPYLFGGMCEGAQIGFEMVKQLEAAGERVGLFAVFDTWPEENTRIPILNRVFHSEIKVRRFLDLPPAEQAQKAAGRLRRLFGGTQSAPSDPGAETDDGRWQKRAFPGPGFVPEKVRSRITVFRSKEQPYWRVHDADLCWGIRTTGGVDVHLIEGKHPLFMREPHVSILGEKLDRLLRAIEGC